MRTALVLLFSALMLSACASEEETAPARPVLEEAWSVDTGLSFPESVVYDRDRDVLYVTNMGDRSADPNGNGYIARVSPAGELLDSAWITGLNAPKGLALREGRLYASDVNELLVIDPEAAAVVQRHPVTGEAYLNDVTVDDQGVVYVTDSRYSKVYRLQNDTLSVWMENGAFRMPNGIRWFDGRLLLAAGDSTSAEPGQNRYLQEVALPGMETRPLRDTMPMGALDAIEPDGRGGLFLSDWGGGTVSHFTEADGPITLAEPGEGTADLTFVPESSLLFVPVMMSDRLIAFRVNQAE